MALQRWWEETTHALWYHTLRDEAYLRHHFRQEVERNLREIIRGQRAQMDIQAQIGKAYLEAYREQAEAVERGFAELGTQIRDLQNAIAWSMEVIADAIESLGQTMSWGFTQFIWHQEQANKLLLAIWERLSSPRTTEAEELRERGNEYFRNGLNAKRPEDRERWINLAIDAYLEAIHKNPADFTVFQSLGVIQFFEKGNSEMALKCFREAAALAEPYSPRHAAMAWSYLGYVHRNRNELEKAYQATLEAVKLQPDWAEANYQHAVHCALTGRMDEMKKHLTQAIQLDADYFPKAAADPDLLPFQEVRNLLQAEMERARKEAEEGQNIIERALQVFSHPVFALSSEERQSLQAVTDAFRQATNYVAIRQALSQYQQKALPFIQETIRNLSITLSGHGGPVSSIAFSPDGRFLASGSHDYTLKIWEVGRWREVTTLRGHEGSVLSVTFSPDGKFLASGSDDKTVKVWEVENWREVVTLKGHEGYVWSVSFNPKGKFLAVGSGDGTIKIWDVVGRWYEVTTLKGHGGAVRSVIYSPNGKFRVSGSSDYTVKVWEVGSRYEVATLRGHKGSVYSVTFSPDSKFLASGSSDKTVRVWEVSSWQEVATLKGHEDAVFSVTFSPDSKFLASGSSDKTVRVWEVSSWQEVATLKGHEDAVFSVAFSPDGKFLASGSSDKTVKVWGWGFQESLSGEVLHDLEVLKRWLEEWEKGRQEAEQKRQEQELRRQRRIQGLCEECGKPLGFWDKLFGRTKCPQCR